MADVNVSFGAVDTEVAKAAQRLVGDLDRTRQRFEGGWQKTGGAIGKSIATAFGATAIARQMIGSVSEGLKEYAKDSDSGAAAMASLAAAQREFIVGLGADYSPFLSGMQEMIRLAHEGRTSTVNWIADLLAGEGHSAEIDALRQKEIQLSKTNRLLKESSEMSRRLRSESLKSQGRGDEAQVFDEQMKHRNEMDTIAQMPAGVQDNLRAAEEERHQSEMARIDREIAARVQKNQMDQVAMRRASAESEARMNAQMREQGQALEFATMEANIGRMRAEGRTKEAAAEQIRLDTLKQILEIKKMEFATDEAKASAISAIYRQQNAELAALDTDEPKDTKRSGQTGTIAAGLAMAGTFGQVFGGSSSSDPVVRETRGVKDQVAKLLPVLKQIQTNTAKASGATFQ